MNPSKRWVTLVNRTLSQRNCTYSEAWRITAGAHPDDALLMSAYGRSRQTVQFFNSREAQKMTPERTRARKQFGEFVNEKVAAGLNCSQAYNAAAREHPDTVATMAGTPSVQFVNANDGNTPVGSPQFKTLFWLPADAPQETFAAAWVANGSTASPLNPAKIFAGLVELAQKRGLLGYDAALAQAKAGFPRLWEAVELLSQEPV
jgi:hypothetical protein